MVSQSVSQDKPVMLSNMMSSKYSTRMLSCISYEQGSIPQQEPGLSFIMGSFHSIEFSLIYI